MSAIESTVGTAHVEAELSAIEPAKYATEPRAIVDAKCTAIDAAECDAE